MDFFVARIRSHFRNGIGLPTNRVSRFGAGLNDITQILNRLASGEPHALDELTPVVYSQLRQIAQKQIGQEDARHWDATELVHEAYMRMVGDVPMAWKNRTHFFAVAAQVIRRVLVDFARQRKSLKRGGQLQQAGVELDQVAAADGDAVNLLALDQALERLSELNSRQAKLVELRFFGGLAETEAAEVLGVSRRTVAGDWAMARAWLRREMNV